MAQPSGPTQLRIRVRPGARRPRVGGRRAGVLVVAVAAPAVDGRATEAALQALAEALGVPRRDLALRHGATSRDKTVTLQDPPADLADRVARLLVDP